LIRWRVGLKELFLLLFSFRKNAVEYRQYLALFFILVFPLIYFIVYTVSKFDPVPVDITSVGIFNLLEPPFKIYRYRLFLQIYPFVFVIIAMGIEYQLAHYTNKVLRAGAWLMVIFITLLALVTTTRMVSWDSFGKGFIYKGYDRDFYSFTIIRHSTDLHKTAKTLLLFDKTQQPKAFRMLGLKCAETMPGDVDGLLNLAKDIPATRRKDFLFGYADYVVLKSLPRPEGALTFFKKIPEAYQPSCYEAYGFRLCYKFFSQGMDLSRIIPSLNYLERHVLYKNLVSLHQESPWDAEGYRNALKAVEKVYLPWCYTGLGRFLGNEKDNQQQFKKILEMIEDHYKQYVYSGFITETARLFLRQQEKLFNPDTIGERSRIFYFSEMKTMIEHLLNAVHQIDSTALVYSYERLGMELRDYLNDRQVSDYFIEKVAKKYHIPLLSGLQQS
jgi:hypothetical protein